MSTAALSIEAIRADPDDRQRWIEYADWLLDRGDARGELINLSLAIDAAAMFSRRHGH